MTRYYYNDGGRNAAFGETARIEFSERGVRDCVARSLAIVTGKPYAEIWDRLAAINATQYKLNSANHGVRTSTDTFRAYAKELGLEWVQPVQTTFNNMKWPAGKAVVAMRDHYTALVDGVMHDTHNPTPAGKAWVYGYWIMKSALFNVISNGSPVNRAPLNFNAAETMQQLMKHNYKKICTIEPYTPTK